MIELGAIRVAEDEVVSMRMRRQHLRLRLCLPWRETPHFVLLPDRFMLRWEHLGDDCLPVHLRSWSCRPGGSATGVMLLDMCLFLGVREEEG